MEHSEEILTTSLLASRLDGAPRQALAQKLRPERHKYDMGHLLLIAGSEGMTGAMVLAAKAAARSGCGLITVAHPAGAGATLNTVAPSVMTREMDWRNPFASIDPISRFTAVAIGPGIGRAPHVAAGVREIATRRNLPPLALDADALWAVSPAGCGSGPFNFSAITAPLVLTPHLGEFKRLFSEELSRGEQSDTVARRFAQSPQRYLILKQAATRIYSPHVSVALNRPNGGMASGGSGDVLLGLLGGLMAWMPSVEIACLSAVLVHSMAGEMARESLGELAMNPSDVVAHLGAAMRELESILRPR